MRLLPVAAFFGALAVTLFIQALAGSKGSVSTLLLLGIAVNSLADAVIGLSTLLATDTRFPSGHLEVLGRRIGKWWGLPLRSVWDWPWSRLFSRPPSMRWLSVKPRPAIWGIR